MNIVKLKEAESKFLERYPGGFSNPALMEIARKHKIEKMCRQAQECFGVERFQDPPGIADSICRIVSQSSMVSVFEKSKFRDLVKTMGDNEKEILALGLKEFLHDEQKTGFEMMVGILGGYKLAKWPLLTVCPYYFKPDFEVFIKPTTVKGVIEYFELEGLRYSPAPSYQFYKAYRDRINIMKREVGAQLQAVNSAFCGFLMISIGNEVPL